MPITIFTFGYYGWGNYMPSLLPQSMQLKRAGASSRQSSLTSASGDQFGRLDSRALPVQYMFFDPATGLNEYKQEAKMLRKDWGLDAVLTPMGGP